MSDYQVQATEVLVHLKSICLSKSASLPSPLSQPPGEIAPGFRKAFIQVGTEWR